MKNKKILIILLIVAVFLIVGGFLLYKLANHKYEQIIPISASELETKLNNKETFILVISQTGCSHCKQYLPELNRTLKNVGLTAYELNITNQSKEETAILNKYVSFSGTPTTVFYKDGVETTTLTRISGYADQNKIIERLKSLGYIE